MLFTIQTKQRRTVELGMKLIFTSEIAFAFVLYSIKRPRRRKSRRKQWLNSHRSRRQAVCNRAEDTSQVLFSSSRVLVSSIASRRTQPESRGGGGSLTNHTQCSRSLLTSSSFTVLPRYKENGEFKCSIFQTRTNTGKNCLQHWEKLWKLKGVPQ